MTCLPLHRQFRKNLEMICRGPAPGRSHLGITETIAFALKDASVRGLLPELKNGSTLSILLVGCHNTVEGKVDFSKLFHQLQVFEVFPLDALQFVEVTLLGPQIANQSRFVHPSGRCAVTRCCGRLERLFPTETTNNYFKK